MSALESAINAAFLDMGKHDPDAQLLWEYYTKLDALPHQGDAWLEGLTTDEAASLCLDGAPCSEVAVVLLLDRDLIVQMDYDALIEFSHHTDEAFLDGAVLDVPTALRMRREALEGPR